MTDQEVVLKAALDAQRILGEYVNTQPSAQHADIALDRLIDIFDQPEVVSAIDRLECEFGRPQIK